MNKTIKLIGIILLTLMLAYILLWKLDYIRFGKAEFENKNQIKTINNSAYETIDFFVGNGDFEKYKGKVIFFNSWATWCGPCKKGIPVLNELFQQYELDSEIVFLSYCSNEKANKIDSVLKEEDLTFQFKKIDASNGLRMSLRKIAVEQNNLKNVDTTNDLVPMNIIIDKQGKIIYYNSAIDKNELKNIFKIIDLEVKK